MNERVPVTPTQERFKVKLGEWKEKFPDIAGDCDWLQKRFGIQISDSLTAWMTDTICLHILKTLHYKHHIPLEEFRELMNPTEAN